MDDSTRSADGEQPHDFRIRFPRDLWRAIHEHLAERKRSDPMRGHTISSVVRDLLIKGLER
jgi:hypothetical protein